MRRKDAMPGRYRAKVLHQSAASVRSDAWARSAVSSSGQAMAPSGAYRVPSREKHEIFEMSAPPAYKSGPDIFRIEGSLPGGYRLARPVSGEVWVEHGEYVADIAELNLHAYGSTRGEALRNVRAAIVEQFLRLGQANGRLSHIMKVEADRLRAVVAESHAHI